jgi:hypothetical protein
MLAEIYLVRLEMILRVTQLQQTPPSDPRFVPVTLPRERPPRAA